MQTTIIKTFDNYFSANIIYTKLLDAGIKCYLKDENTATIYPIFNNSIGGIKLLVHISDADEATDLLMHFEDEYLQTIHCPVCNENEIIAITSIKKNDIITRFFTKLFSTTQIMEERYYQCQHCLYESKTIPIPIVES